MENKIKAQSENIAKFLAFCEAVKNTPEAKSTKGYIEGKNQLIGTLWSKIDAANDEIIEGVTPEYLVTVGPEVEKSFKSIKTEYGKAFNMFDEVTIHIFTVLEKLNQQAIPQLQPLQLPENLVLNTHNKSNIKLKSIDIPTFSGDYKKWITFKNMFDSLVHNSKEFSKIQKMHYLKSSLTKEAERLISQFDVTEEAYDPAYAAITGRFHNEVILVDTHIICILSQPDLTSESSHGLKELMDVTTENLRALQSLGIDTDSWDPILLLLLIQKLDQSTRRLWEQNLKPKTRPTIKEFLEFLANRFHALGCQQKFKFSMESSSKTHDQERNKNNFSSENRNYSSNNYKPRFQDSNFPPRIHQSFHNSSQQSCPICAGENHSIFSCEKFRKANQRTRVEMVNYAKLCRRCLRKHQSDCTQREGCRACGGNHHTFLHLDRQEDKDSLATQNQQDTQSKNSSEQNSQSATIVNSHHATLQRSADASKAIVRSHHVKTVEINQIDRNIVPWDAPVLLATAIVLIRSLKNNNFYPFRCLLDQGGEASHISQSVARLLGLQEKPVSAAMVGLGGVTIGSSKNVVSFELGSKSNQEFRCNVQALVVSKVANPLPSTFIQKTDWKHIEGLRLADPEFYKPANIDVILGTAVLSYLLLPGLRKGKPNSPIAQNTELGWILSGATEPDPKTVNKSNDHLEIKSTEKKI